MTAKVIQAMHVKHTSHVRSCFKVSLLMLMDLVLGSAEVMDLLDQLPKKWHLSKKVSTNFVPQGLLVSVWKSVGRYVKVSCREHVQVWHEQIDSNWWRFSPSRNRSPLLL